MTGSEPGGVAVPDTPQSADSKGQPPSDVALVVKRAHRFLVPVLLVLATIIGIPGALAVWVDRQALNMSNWSSIRIAIAGSTIARCLTALAMSCAVPSKTAAR